MVNDVRMGKHAQAIEFGTVSRWYIRVGPFLVYGDDIQDFSMEFSLAVELYWHF